MLIPVTNPDPSDQDVFTKPMADFTLEEKQMVGGLEITSDMVCRVILGHKAKEHGSKKERRAVMQAWEQIASGDIWANKHGV